MLKKSLFAVAVVALLAAMAPAGEIKLVDWPKAYVAQELTDIPVLMDVGFWVYIKDQDKLKIKLAQTSQSGAVKHTYEGTTDVAIQCNFDLKLSTSHSKVGSWKGDIGSSVTPNTLSAGGGTVTVKATASNVELGTGGFVGGTKDVHVMTVTLKVAPQ
jgi:hypothetical protein